MVLLLLGSFCVFFFLVLFFTLSLSNRIHLQSHLLFLHSRLYPQVVAGKRYFMFSLGNLEGLCGVGLHISAVSDAGRGYRCPKAWLAGRPNCLPHCWGYYWVAAGSLATCFLVAPLACGLSVVGLLQSRRPRSTGGS